MNSERLAKYARLALESGVGLQPGQRLLISSQINAAPLVRSISDLAYRMGSRYVSVFWEDETIRRSRFDHAPRDSFSELHEWQAQAANESAEAGDALLGVFSMDPGLLAGIDPELIQIETRTLESKRERFWELLGSNTFNWSVIPMATPAWAAHVFVNDTNAVEKLQAAIDHALMIDHADPGRAWAENVNRLKARSQFLNVKRYASLRYSGLGTKLEVGLADDHHWDGGGNQLKNGTTYIANLPTFEIFTAPHRLRVNGTVRGTKPINANGELVEGWSLEFKDGRVVNAHAARGLAGLEGILDTDENSRFLGEVALVPSGSPVDQTGLVFRNTLMDENAASHIAVGFAYRTSIRGGGDMSGEEFTAKGGNRSMEHRDVMIGSSDVEIDGVFADGSSEPLMRNGQFAFEE